MKRGEPSATARRVAAQRLVFERVDAPYGDPEADDRLARDVAGDLKAREGGWMVTHLAARTTFFDRVVTAALERDFSQVVLAAAGYDGRAWRYAKPGVKWFEVDHPDTQRDKLERIGRLGLGADHVAFVPADFAADELGPRLLDAGLDPGTPTLMLCEGVAVYLEQPVLASLLGGLRSVAAPDSRLAISLMASSRSPWRYLRRARFQAAVSAMGEPAHTFLTRAAAETLLADGGWQIAPAQTASSGESQTARRAGFLVVAPT